MVSAGQMVPILDAFFWMLVGFLDALEDARLSNLGRVE